MQQLTFDAAIIIAIGIGLSQNPESEYPCVIGFHARKWLTGILICYCIDLAFLLINIYSLKTKFYANLWVLLFRFLLLIAIVV